MKALVSLQRSWNLYSRAKKREINACIKVMACNTDVTSRTQLNQGSIVGPKFWGGDKEVLPFGSWWGRKFTISSLKKENFKICMVNPKVDLQYLCFYGRFGPWDGAGGINSLSLHNEHIGHVRLREGRCGMKSVTGHIRGVKLKRDLQGDISNRIIRQSLKVNNIQERVSEVSLWRYKANR